MTDIALQRRPLAGMMQAFARIDGATRSRVIFALPAALLFGSVLAGAQAFIPAPVGSATSALPAPPLMDVRQLAPVQAVAVNRDIPLATGPNPAATAFEFKGSAVSRAQALQCLTSAVYYEAGNESADGGAAVAQVILNRVRHPAFPASVCGVVYQGSTRETGCQFTFTCDGSLARTPDSASWARSRRIAEAALSGSVFAPVGWATHYHANYVVPYWAPTLAKSAVIGAHLFYRWAGNWGRGPAFAQRYTGAEANASFLRTAALSAEAATVAVASGDVPAAIADIPGAEVVKLTPSMRGDKRVAVRFNQTARKATDEVVHKPYVEKVQASDNLRWTLTNAAPASTERPLGQSAPAPASTTAGGAPAPAPQP